MVYRQEKIKPYNDKEEKGAQVEQMFDNIAHSYDKLNHRLSWNIDKLWRKRALNRLKPYKPQSILDIATGTGDFAIQAAQTSLFSNNALYIRFYQLFLMFVHRIPVRKQLFLICC